MYPLGQSQPYPFNQWYVAALSEEVGRELLPRTILDLPVVLYRTEGGTATAVHGLCPHRLYPLGDGRLVGDAIECGYHGFVFDCTGRCTKVPTQERIPVSFAIKAYPIVERTPLVWIWPGDPKLADPATIPDMAAGGIDAPGFETMTTLYLPLRARYTLLIDNLMDLSHLAFVHRASVGEGEGGGVLVEPQIRETPRSYHVTRSFAGVPNQGFTRMLFPDYDGLVDIDTTSDYLAPAWIPTAAPHVYASAGDGIARRPLGRVWFNHAITPETPRSTHYFNVGTRDYRFGEPAFTEMWRQMNRSVLLEDIAVLERIERHVDRFADTKKELSVLADAGAIRVRQMLAAQIAAESGERQASPVGANR